MADNYINALGLSALKSWIMSKIPVVDSALSSTSENPVQNKVIKAYVDGKSSGAFASMFDIALSDVYHVTNEADAPIVISNELNLDGFVTPIGTSGISWRKPDVVIPTIQWGATVDENYDITGTGTVKVLFGEAGYLEKAVTFKKPGEGKLYACELTDKQHGYIDTGIQADYAYTLHAKGYAGSSTSVLIGAYVSNTERTEFRLLPSSSNVQHMWPVNTQINGTTHGINVKQELEYWQMAGYFKMSQGTRNYTSSPSGNYTSGNPNSNLFLLNDGAGVNAFGYGTLCFAEILSGDTQIAYYAPYRIVGDEVVIINTSGLTAQQIYDLVQNGDGSAYAANRILRPMSGELIEVTAA